MSAISGAVARTAASLLAHLRGCDNILFLTGAGVSTASGIPDYRSPNAPVYKPLQHGEFVNSAAVRQRYWARSFLGWPRFRCAQPNSSHAALVRLSRAGLCANLITQNVDRLHQKAGHAPAPLELHGALFEVACIACTSERAICRDELQGAMAAANAEWVAALGGSAELRPDGDVEIEPAVVASFAPPTCAACGRDLMKPEVVFYGGTIPPSTVEASLALAERAGAVVVSGSTVSTFSAFRLVRAVAARGRPVAVLTRGATRADALATFKAEHDVGELLTEVAGAI
jgi:NAD-dependent SIR2 family protein deacetylase